MHLAGQGTSQDNAKAAEWFTKAAAMNDAEAQYQIGRMRLYGIGVSTDADKALEWWKRAAQNGSKSAKKNLPGLRESLALEKAASKRVGIDAP